MNRATKSGDNENLIGFLKHNPEIFSKLISILWEKF